MFTITCGLILTSITLNAQKRDSGTIELIPNIGYSRSFLSGDEVDGLDSRDALQFGVIGDYYFNDRWSIRSGLSYFSMGASVSGSELQPVLGSELRLDLQLGYLNIPINANWHFGSMRKWNLNFGVTPGFLLKGDINGQDVKDFYKSFQLAISYGIGYKIEVSDSFSILIDGQGLFGVTNILKDSDDFTIKNTGNSINVGGIFSF
ncbi:MAG: outer membrane beta-barrel protein [Flavobacteriaceae bacterium]|nr:MAG: outer membrane beta-barrel protein [Flavobacteriaceae bacterium]